MAERAFGDVDCGADERAEERRDGDETSQRTERRLPPWLRTNVTALIPSGKSCETTATDQDSGLGVEAEGEPDGEAVRERVEGERAGAQERRPACARACCGWSR